MKERARKAFFIASDDSTPQVYPGHSRRIMAWACRD
jgi:hypothetical protein